MSLLSVSEAHPETSVATDSTESGRKKIAAALQKITSPERVKPLLISAGIVSWLLFAAICAFLPNSELLPQRDQQFVEGANGFTIGAALVLAASGLILWVLSTTQGKIGSWATTKVARGSAWYFASGVWLIFWVFTTAKTAIFPPPYLVAPQEILYQLWDSRGLLLESLGNSLLLLTVGFLVGLISGLLTGILIGWFQTANYWVHPILIYIGPVPALAWVPIVFVLFPTAYSGAVFMIALSVWFPITVLTRAGILSVPRSYFDVAQTLGANSWFLVLRVSLPAALPSIFTGAFMALGASFVSLTVAENFGVNSGLGWFLNWKKGWGDFPGLYAGLLTLVVVCGVLLTLLFRLRNYVLRWEKGLTRW